METYLLIECFNPGDIPDFWTPALVPVLVPVYSPIQLTAPAMIYPFFGDAFLWRAPCAQWLYTRIRCQISSFNSIISDCMVEHDIDYNRGVYITYGRRNSLEECAQWCRSRPGCNYWVLRTTDNICHLKGAKVHRRSAAHHIAGSKGCLLYTSDAADE